MYLSGEKQFNFEPAVPYFCNTVAAANFAAAKAPVSHYSRQLGRGLTGRSTGPIAAGRHLGYKSLAQMPAYRNRPVTLYVRPHPIAPRSKPKRYGESTQQVGSNANVNAFCRIPANAVTTSKFTAANALGVLNSLSWGAA